MKTLRRLLLTLTFLFTSMFIFNTMADEPLDSPPPPPGGGHGGGGNSQGAPIDGGLGILLVLGAGYGAKKLYKNRQEKRETTTKEEVSE
jgi:hypothetical protein